MGGSDNNCVFGALWGPAVRPGPPSLYPSRISPAWLLLQVLVMHERGEGERPQQRDGPRTVKEANKYLQSSQVRKLH
ncbi:unnamed protein product [Boreogadus saida]